MPEGKRSPLLDRAQRATCYFDRKRNPNDRRGGGRWVSLIRVDDNVHITEHETQAQARAHIGLRGGSRDPAYRPAFGSTDYDMREFKVRA
jgi:hypothetical protein